MRLVAQPRKKKLTTWRINYGNYGSHNKFRGHATRRRYASRGILGISMRERCRVS
jgi:hypothetical protein